MLLGRQVAVYKITEFLGEGGFAYVYKARDANLDIDVALKVLKPAFAYDEVFEENFRKEAHRAAKFRHPNVVAVHYAGKDDDIVFFSMDLLEAGLKDLVEGGKVLDDKMIIKVGMDVASALQFAHTHEGGIVHRDLKPDNILFDRHGNAVVTDFGISEAANSYTAATGTTVYVGTPKYMSPEQARGQRVDHRSDIYSLGVTLYEMAAGNAPFTGRDWFELGRKHIEQDPPLPREKNPNIDARLERVVLKCLQKDPAMRYQRADHLRADLAEIAGHPDRVAAVDAPNAGPQPAAASVHAPGTLPGYATKSGGFSDATTQPVKTRKRGFRYALVAIAVFSSLALAYDLNVGGIRTLGEAEIPSLANLPFIGTGKVYATIFRYPSVEGGADIDTDFTITFSGPIDATTASRNHVKLLGPGNRPIDAEIMLSPSGTRLAVQPVGQLAYETDYTITWTAGLVSLAGDPVLQNPRVSAPGGEFRFRTRNLPPDTDPPALRASTPASNTQNAPVDKPITLTFSEQMRPASLTNKSVKLIDAEGNEVAIDVLLSSDFTIAQIQPREALVASMQYRVELAEVITDASGNALPATTLAFSTAGATASPSPSEPARPALLTVRASPREAMPQIRLLLDGEDLGVIPSLNITLQANERHTVTLLAQPPFSQHRLVLHEESFVPRAGQNIEIDPQLRPFGSLTIAADPAADVFVDGKYVGATPVAGYPLFSGEHELELHPAANSNTYSIYKARFTLGPFERKSLGSVKLPRR